MPYLEVDKRPELGELTDEVILREGTLVGIRIPRDRGDDIDLGSIELDTDVPCHIVSSHSLKNRFLLILIPTSENIIRARELLIELAHIRGLSNTAYELACKFQREILDTMEAEVGREVIKQNPKFDKLPVSFDHFLFYLCWDTEE